MNSGEELFANLVGSWDKRPEATTRLDNLFLDVKKLKILSQ